jgi:hypothetical protein
MSSQDDRFVAVNPDWNYAIVGQGFTPVSFNPQPQERWMAHANAEKFFLLEPATVVRMLNEALCSGFIVCARHNFSGSILHFQKQNKATL